MYKGRYANSGVKCPYYKCQTNCMIVCDGVDGAASSMQTFASPAGRKLFQIRFCGYGLKGHVFSGDYTKCRIYKSLKELEDERESRENT